MNRPVSHNQRLLWVCPEIANTAWPRALQPMTPASAISTTVPNVTTKNSFPAHIKSQSCGLSNNVTSSDKISNDKSCKSTHACPTYLKPNSNTNLLTKVSHISTLYDYTNTQLHSVTSSQHQSAVLNSVKDFNNMKISSRLH